MSEHTINITLPEIQRTYIFVCEDETDYQERISNATEVMMCVMDSHSGDPALYHPSTRTTNNDNEKSMTYPSLFDDIRHVHVGNFVGDLAFPVEEFRIDGGISAVWGYSGWIWEDASFTDPITDEVRTLQGGHHIQRKGINKVFSVFDGNQLHHIQHFVYEQPDVALIENFDTSNLEVLYPISIPLKEIDINLTDFSNVLSILPEEYVMSQRPYYVTVPNTFFRNTHNFSTNSLVLNKVRFVDRPFLIDADVEAETITVTMHNIEYVSNLFVFLYSTTPYFNYRSKYKPVLGNNLKMLSGYFCDRRNENINLNEYLGTTFENLDLISGGGSGTNSYTINIPYKERECPLIIGGQATSDATKCGIQFGTGTAFASNVTTIDLHNNDIIVWRTSATADSKLTLQNPGDIYITHHLIGGRKYSGVDSNYPSTCEYSESVGMIDFEMFDGAYFDEGSTFNFNCKNQVFANYFKSLGINNNATYNITNITGCKILTANIGIYQTDPVTGTISLVSDNCPVSLYDNNLDPTDIDSYKVLQCNRIPTETNIYVHSSAVMKFNMVYNGESNDDYSFTSTYNTSLPQCFGKTVSNKHIYIWGGSHVFTENNRPDNEPYISLVGGGLNFYMWSETTPVYHYHRYIPVNEDSPYVPQYSGNPGQKAAPSSGGTSFTIPQDVVHFQGENVEWYLDEYTENGVHYYEINNNLVVAPISSESDNLIYFELGKYQGGFNITSRNLDIPTFAATIYRQTFQYQHWRPSIRIHKTVRDALIQNYPDMESFMQNNFYSVTAVEDE